MMTDKEEAMTKRVILSEKPEAQREAVLWAKEELERINRSDEATKKMKEKFTQLFLDNIKKAKAI